MKKFTIIAALMSGVLTFPVLATTVQFGAASPSARTIVVENDDLTGVPNGSLVWAGVFSSPNSFAYSAANSILANVNNMVSMGGFQAFGFAVGSYSNGTWTSENSTDSLAVNGSPGQVSLSMTDNTGTPGSGQDASFFDNKQLYLVIFNGTTVANSTQMGIFESASWTFKANNQGLGGDIGTYATNTSTSMTAVDGAGSVVSSPSPALELAATPEPSSLVATLLGAGGLVTMLRRRRVA